MPSNLALRAELALLRLLADISLELPEDGLHIQVQAGRWRVGMAIGLALSANKGTTTFPADEPLSPCERDCLEILPDLIDKTGRRQTARDIDQALRAAGRPWGWATLTASLSNLVAIGLLVNPRDKRGYGMADNTGQNFPP